MIELHVRSGSVAHWPARPLNPQLSTNLLPPVPDQRPFAPRGSSLDRRPLPLNHEHSTLNHFVTQVLSSMSLPRKHVPVPGRGTFTVGSPWRTPSTMASSKPLTKPTAPT